MESIDSPRWPLALAMLVVGAAIGAVGFWLVAQDSDSNAAEDTAEAVQTTLVAAESRDFESFSEWDGILQSGTTASVGASARGTITRSAQVGSRIELGDEIAELDGSPVIAMYGTVPQFRQLDSTVEDGADINQLEANLVALGYDPDGLVTVDETFTSETGFMIERWELDLGLELDGIVELGQIAFIPGPSEVLSQTSVGNLVNAGQELLTVSTLAESGFVFPDSDPAPEGSQIVAIADESGSLETGRPTNRWELPQSAITIEVDVDEADTFAIGTAVTVELPGDQTVAAEVTEISDVARQIQNGQDTATVVDVTVQPTEDLDSAFTAGPVIILVENGSTFGATVVPVRSLVALADGGHAIEIEDRGLVGVELGAFDDGWVEITNGVVEPGESVVAPL